MDQPDAALEEQPASDDKLAEVHKRALMRFDAAVMPQQEVRRLALEARRFIGVPGAQWDGSWGEQYENTPKLQIDKLARSVRKIENDYRQNRIVPDFRPAGGSSDNDTADTLDGLHRADSYHFKCQAARDNAFSEAVQGGFGAYRLTNEWADPLDKDSDAQRINPALLIADADQTVFFDPDSKRYDKSDARFAFVLSGSSPESFAETWGKDKATAFPQGVVHPQYDAWFAPDTIAVAEYYEIEDVSEQLLIFELEATGEEVRHWRKEIDQSDIDDLMALGWSMRRRTVKRRRCHKYVLSGAEVLAGPMTIAGGEIPIVPMYGNRFYIDGIEWFQGHVQPKMDAQRLYNSSVTNVAEINSLAPYERPIFAAEQMPPNIAALWERGNIDRHPYALVNPLLNPDGTFAAIGPIGKVEPPSVPQTTAALLEISNRDLMEDDQDGAEQVKANTSADAMDIAAARVDAKSGIYLDNMRQSIQREGELYLCMAREVYAEPGRVVETMTEEGDDATATLYEDYRDGDELKTRNDFASGSYKVIADVTEATATRRDRTVKQMLNVATVAIQAQDMEGAQAALITAGLNMDGEGLDDYLAWTRRRALALGLVQPTEDEQREQAEAQSQEQQQPDPNTVLALSQAEALKAGAEKDRALTGKAVADTKVSEAKVVETLASAADKRVQAGLRPVEAANDRAPEPRIRMGYELAQ